MLREGIGGVPPEGPNSSMGFAHLLGAAAYGGLCGLVGISTSTIGISWDII